MHDSVSLYPLPLAPRCFRLYCTGPGFVTVDHRATRTLHEMISCETAPRTSQVLFFAENCALRGGLLCQRAGASTAVPRRFSRYDIGTVKTATLKKKCHFLVCCFPGFEGGHQEVCIIESSSLRTGLDVNVQVFLRQSRAGSGGRAILFVRAGFSGGRKIKTPRIMC